MEILALGIISRKPALVELTSNEVKVRELFERYLDTVPGGIPFAAKLALQRAAAESNCYVGDEFIAYLSDDSLIRFGGYRFRIKPEFRVA